ncbi:MAG: hypothetical protein M3N97_13655 [Pseudomonadota bacterium]|nr:hypothetical protein [Pseudomonadota bacterium]
MSSHGDRFVTAARTHADTVLKDARDRWGSYRTPLLADGLHLDSREPVTWVQDGRQWILSNPASQQNFLRVLSGLERLGSGASYRNAGQEITRYVMRHMRLGDMMWWGAHCTADLLQKRLVFCSDGSVYPRHELERCFPFYELMNEIDPKETRRIIEATWEQHMCDWSVLSFNRHNISNLPPGRAPDVSLWDNAYTGGPFTSERFTFMPAGIDLAYSAAMLHRFSGDERPLLWSRRLVSCYMQAAHPSTGLPVYLYNASYRPKSTTRPERPDRAATQLGPEVGEAVEERSVWMPRQAREALYCFIALMELSSTIDEPWFARSAVLGLKAFAAHVFDARDGLLHPVLTDGTRLTGLVLQRDGYFGARGTTLKAQFADGPALLAFAQGYRHSEDPLLWEACAVLTTRLKLGCLGPPGGSGFEPNRRCASSEPLALLAMIALHRATGRPAFLELAEQIGDNMMEKRLRTGLFVAPGQCYARIDALDPLALLHLAQALEGMRSDMPVWFGGRGRFHARYDGRGRTTDSALFYDLRN